MKVTTLKILGGTYHLFYNSEAMLTLQDEFGSEIVTAFNPTTKDGKKALCRAVEVMAEQGELARRYMGYDQGKFITADTVGLFLTPAITKDIYDTVIRAMLIGVGREVEDKGKEVDLVLQELEKKTGKN